MALVQQDDACTQGPTAGASKNNGSRSRVRKVQVCVPFAMKTPYFDLCVQYEAGRRAAPANRRGAKSETQTHDNEVFCRDISTGLWYKARIVGAGKAGMHQIEWSPPFDGRCAISPEDIKSDDTGLVATDDNPPTEWNVSGTSSQAAPALVRLNHHRSQVYLHVF